MTDNGNTPKDQRNLTVEINRNEDRGYTILSVKDNDSHKMMADVIIPDEILISETYRMGGNIKPFIVMHEILLLVCESINASFNKIIPQLDESGPEINNAPPKAD